MTVAHLAIEHGRFTWCLTSMNDEQLAAALPDVALRANARDRNVVAGAMPVNLALTFAGVVLPLVCFAMSFPKSPDWQSGSVSAYAELLLSRKCSAPLYPILIYCMVSMALVVWQPGRFENSFRVRLGVHFGVLVAAECWLIFQLATSGSPAEIPLKLAMSALAAVAPWGAWRLALGLRRSDYEWVYWSIVVVLGISAPWSIPLGFVLCLWSSTTWAFAAYLFVAIRLVRGRGESRFHFSLAQLFGLFGVLAAHFAAWRLSFVWMLEEYAKLPTVQPTSCFVCTAVAKGHPRVVRSEAWQTGGGATCRVNDQLRTLKAFELLLLTLSPSAHRQCRWVYDRVGPRAAALIFHPLFADAGYFLLKPLEWCARVCLCVAIPRQMDLVRGLYRALDGRRP